MGKQNVGYHHSDRTHQKAGLTAEGHTGDDDKRQHRLELRQHEERRSASHTDDTQYCNGHKLPCFGFSAFKHKKEWKHTFHQHQEGGNVVMLISQIHHTGKNSQRDEQENQYGGNHGASAEFSLLGRDLHHGRWSASAANGNNKHTQRSNQNDIEF